MAEGSSTYFGRTNANLLSLIVYTTTNTYTTQIPTVIYETVNGPDVTKTENDIAYTTITSLCPGKEDNPDDHDTY